jgi:hypothetical protein
VGSEGKKRDRGEEEVIPGRERERERKQGVVGCG